LRPEKQIGDQNYELPASIDRPNTARHHLVPAVCGKFRYRTFAGMRKLSRGCPYAA